MPMKKATTAVVSMLTSLAVLAVAGAALAKDLPSEVTLFKNVNVFDGTSDQLLEGHDVLVVRNMIEKVAKDIPTSGTYEFDVKTGGLERLDMPQMHDWHAGRNVVTIYEDDKTVKKEVSVNVIDGGGRTLMPGLIDAHWHMFNPLTMQDVMTAHLEYIHAKIAVEAEKTLLRGFTTIREPGGNSFGLKRAIDEGILVGPRILPSGAPISQTSGHFDFAQPWEPPKRLGGQPSRPARYGMLRVVDGADDALAAARFNLKQGTDFLFDPASNGVQASQLARFGKWLSNAKMLRLITSENARLLELSGERHPYREGPLGVIREGAYADILLVDGNPLDDVSILGDGGKNFPLIMKNGAIYKNTL
jgi:imidazolonepropionase-like amidohydrolase